MNVKVIAIIVVAIIGIIGVGILGGDSTSTNTASVNTQQNSQGTNVNMVEVVEAADFECPACASFYPILKQVQSEYSDKVQFTFKHFPLTAIHPNAFSAHRAAQAAANQGKFWEMHDLLFEQRALWITQTTSDPVSQLEAFAEQLELDLIQFKEDFASADVNAFINNDISEMRELGAEATPTFFINGERVDNRDLDSPAKFSAVLDNALAEAGFTDDTTDQAQTEEARLETEETTDEN